MEKKVSRIAALAAIGLICTAAPATATTSKQWRLAGASERAGLKKVAGKATADRLYIVSRNDPRIGAVCTHTDVAGNEGTIYRRATPTASKWRYVDGGSMISSKNATAQALHAVCMDWRGR